MPRLSSARPWLTAALTLTALVGWAVPATAAALVYETRQVTAIAPDADPGTAQHATIDIPTGYDRYRRSWHKVEWVESVARRPVGITLDLEPRRSTQRELRRERDRLASSGYEYAERQLEMYEPGGRLLARWVFTLQDPGTAGPAALVTVYLTGTHDRLTVVGSGGDPDLAKQVRHHVLHSLRTG